jgi:hypothetical protein
MEEDEGIDNDDDEEKALVETEPEPNVDDDNTLDTTTNTNTTTDNTTTTIINDSDPAYQWKEERWHQDNDDTSKRSSDTSISHQSGTGSGTKVLIVCQDEIIVEINGQHASAENSDIEMDTNGDSLQDEDEEEEEEEANSEQKLLKTCNNNNELVAVKVHSDVKSSHNGVGVNGFDEICLKINQMGW